jgi:3-deoxy-D-manno-octulosonic-acid transferase
MQRPDLARMPHFRYSLAAVYVLYTFFLCVALALYCPYYAVRMKILRRERLYLKERLGFDPISRDPARPGIWIHAVSVGEVLSVQNFVERLRARHPEWDIFVSTHTNSGMRIAREKLVSADKIFFVPLDIPWVVRRIFRAVDPRVLVLAESEFWPNLLREAARRGTRVLVVNGRISKNSHKNYSKIRPLIRKIFRNVDRFLVQTDLDRIRLEELGVPGDKIGVAGNLKSEVHLAPLAADQREFLRESLGIPEHCRVVVAGSTRKGEEEIILRAFRNERRPDGLLRLILAPRQIERAGELAKAAREDGLTAFCRTEMLQDRPPARDWDVLILDTLGELARFYALSDSAFVGGSLVEWGGHNILEPAFHAKPVYFGPHMGNFAHLAECFLKGGGARVVRNEEDLSAMFRSAGSPNSAEMGGRARVCLDALPGATDRTIGDVERLVNGFEDHNCRT